VSDFLSLTKPRITLLVVLTAYVGFALATEGAPDAVRLGGMLLGTALVAAGASTLNMVMERRTDGLMFRTRQRPLPAGRLGVAESLVWGGALTVSGLVVLAVLATGLSAIVAFVTWASYLFAYTPLKPRTSLSTLVGAIPGALPPVIGWTAAAGRLEPGAGLLFAILFLWQLPHFLAIAWLYREDYARGGLPMLPVVDPSGRLAGRQAVVHTIALVGVSVTPWAVHLAGPIYLAGALGAGAAFLAVAVRTARLRTLPAARALFVASVLYLVVLCGLLLADRV
jgi:protoheme IX farnesyltransferase